MYTKITKRQARKMYEENKNFIIVPRNCHPDGCLALTMGPVTFEHMIGYNFDQMVNSFTYYNCNHETGYYPAFYIKN